MGAESQGAPLNLIKYVAVILIGIDGHTSWGNHKALQLADARGDVRTMWSSSSASTSAQSSPGASRRCNSAQISPSVMPGDRQWRINASCSTSVSA